ncbi:MAG: SagB/ThcOx family dehydrogenase [Thermoplasmata archaeon]
MAKNVDIEAARGYHEETKHSPAGIRSALHQLDWANKPALFKRYKDLPYYPLPTDFAPPAMATLRTISSAGEGATLDLVTLAQILYFAAGITKEAQGPDGSTHHFRAAACAGALYPIEVYVACRALDGLPPGVYHLAPRELALTQLRAGDFRSPLAEATGEGGGASPATVVLTAIFWRSAWKYKARSYRYCFWDSGTILANLLAAATSAGLSARLVTGFVDTEVDRLLGLDGDREGSLCLVPLGPLEERPAAPRDAPVLDLATPPLSREEVDYPQIRRMHRASYLDSPGSVRAWRGALRRGAATAGERTYPLSVRETEGRPLGEVILGRGSTRHFRRTPIALEELSSILYYATQGWEADFLEGPDTRLVDLYLLANEVEGLPGGSYYFAGSRGHLELLREGEFRPWAGFLGLEQALPADASAVVFFLADLQRVLGRFGNRGYRIAQLEAGILGGRMYLAAYALGLGATGLTFYDDEIVDFFSPHAAGKDAIFMVALGRAVKIRSPVRPVPVPFRERDE